MTTKKKYKEDVVQLFLKAIEPEKREMLRAFNEDLLPPPIAVENIKSLMDIASLNGTKLQEIDKIKSGNGYVWNYNGVLSCWVKVGYKGYRDAYRKYLNQFFSFNFKLPNEYDIDHLFNQGRGKKYDSGYLRLFPVLRKINREHGAIFENRVTKSESKRNMKILHFMTFISVLKILGISPPKNTKNKNDLERISILLSDKLTSWSKEEIEKNLISLIERTQNPAQIIIAKI